MQAYYAKRAHEYEEIYTRDDPARQQELQTISALLKTALQNKIVLEIACGTGYWTIIASQTAQEIMATDAVQEVLDIAKSKTYACPVMFAQADAYKLSFSKNKFTGGLANFWFSHIPKEKIGSFLKNLHRVLHSGATIVMVDNNFVKGVGGEFIKKPNDENTYKLRTLKNGEKNLILKNYYSLEELMDIFKKYDKSFSKKNIFYGKCFWQVTYCLSNRLNYGIDKL